MQTILIAFLILIPILALVLGLYYFKDQRTAARARLREELLDRQSQRWLAEHRLHYDQNGNPVIHIGDLDLEYFGLAPGNTGQETKILFSNGQKIEVRPERPIEYYKGSRGLFGTPDKAVEPPVEPPAVEPEPEPELKQLTAGNVIPEDEPPAEPTDLELLSIITQAKQDGMNQKDAVYLITGKRKGGSPEWQKWAAIYNSIQL